MGRNAFAHESGIHQDGVLKERTTYEIMAAESVGFDDTTSIVLGKHSGRHALQSALMELGFEVTGQTLNQAFKRFKELADKKKQVTAMDLEALVTDELRSDAGAYTLEWFDVEASSRRPPHATVSILTPGGRQREGDFTGDGPVDAIFRAINAATNREARLREFRIDAVTGGQDALGEASVMLELSGQSASGQGVSTDIIEAAALAYVRALSNVERKVPLAADSAAEPSGSSRRRRSHEPAALGERRVEHRRRRGSRPSGSAPSRPSRLASSGTIVWTSRAAGAQRHLLGAGAARRGRAQRAAPHRRSGEAERRARRGRRGPRRGSSGSRRRRRRTRARRSSTGANSHGTAHEASTASRTSPGRARRAEHHALAVAPVDRGDAQPAVEARAERVEVLAERVQRPSGRGERRGRRRGRAGRRARSVARPPARAAAAAGGRPGAPPPTRPSADVELLGQPSRPTRRGAIAGLRAAAGDQRGGDDRPAPTAEHVLAVAGNRAPRLRSRSAARASTLRRASRPRRGRVCPAAR